MPLVAELRRESLRIMGRGTLLRRLLAAGLPVASSCSGSGACGKCVVRVLEGAQALSPPDEHEREVLQKNCAAAGERLSCRCRVRDATASIRVATGYW